MKPGIDLDLGGGGEEESSSLGDDYSSLNNNQLEGLDEDDVDDEEALMSNNEDNQTSAASTSTTTTNNSGGGGGGVKRKLKYNYSNRKRKCRTTFTKGQLNVLEAEFVKSNFVSNDKIDLIVDQTGLDSRIIKVREINFKKRRK